MIQHVFVLGDYHMSDLARKIYQYVVYCQSEPECIFHVTKQDIIDGIDEIIKNAPIKKLEEIRDD